mmetsp:Transcript_10373/g.14639  ORF Transcript_10373/g.14639 Transcript_10373/m.14639 type:complete len:134 (-) Transcript_10373:56-457(-)
MAQITTQSPVLIEPEDDYTPPYGKTKQGTLTKAELLRRKRFYCFMKILSTYLERRDPTLRSQVKSIVNLCTRKNREGDLEYNDLIGTIRQRVRCRVGDRHWAQCEKYFLIFLEYNQKKMSSRAQLPIVIEDTF